jgi:Family of unknown function (DUF6788)
LAISRKKLLEQLELAAQTMVQGALSATTRTCGKSACPCHVDAARRHGPNVYFTWRTGAKYHALYVPPEYVEEAKSAHEAWARFWEIGCALAALNREELKKRWAQKNKRTSARSTV